MTGKKTCFVISPIGNADSDTRKRSNLTYEYIIRPVVEKFGYHLTRADYIKDSGIITSQIIDQIFESSLVIADLSDNNPNVFYELAIRHVIQKPYVQMMKSDQKIPFDINALRTISFDIDLKSAEKAKKELFDQIESIENSNFNPDNPITSAIHQSSIRKILTSRKDIPQDDFSKVVLESVSELRSLVLDLKSDFYNFKSFDNKSDFVTTQNIEILEEIDYEIHVAKSKIDNLEHIIDRYKDATDINKIHKSEDAISELKNLKARLKDLLNIKYRIPGSKIKIRDLEFIDL